MMIWKYLKKKEGIVKDNDIDREGIDEGSCGQINWPVTCLLFSKKIDNVIWALPKWVYDNNAKFNQALIIDKNKQKPKYIRSNKEDKDEFLLSGIDIVSQEKYDNKDSYSFYHAFEFERIHVDSKNGWKNLTKSIDKYSKFILDIDLDFFVTNGDKHSIKEYKKFFYDLESHNRVHKIPGIKEPRAIHESTRESLDVKKELNKECRIIIKRVKVFLDGLTKLKNQNIIPSCISISDSCSSFFSGDIDRGVFTNEYTPKYFVPLLHILLLDGFKKIYGTNKFF